MAFPDATSLEALWDGDIGEEMTVKTATEGTADAYGETSKTWGTGTAIRGRFRIVGAHEDRKEFGNLVPGDAIAYVKLAATVTMDSRIVHNSINYEVVGIVAKRTHQEIACKRVL